MFPNARDFFFFFLRVSLALDSLAKFFGNPFRLDPPSPDQSNPLFVAHHIKKDCSVIMSSV